jgi:hypothetical protein
VLFPNGAEAPLRVGRGVARATVVQLLRAGTARWNAVLAAHVYTTMRRPLLIPLVLGSVLALGTACTGSGSDGIATSVGPGKPLLNTAPPVPGEGHDVEITVREGGRLDILTWGSSSCPYVPVDMKRLAKDRVRVVMEKRSNSDSEVCTADLSPTVATVELPDDVDDERFRLDLRGVGTERSLGAGVGFTNAGGGGDGRTDSL